MGKNRKNSFSSKINSNLCQCLYCHVSVVLNIPYNSLNSPSSPFYGQNVKKRFFQNCHFWPILVLFITYVFGPINRGSFGPNGCFPRTFWPKPSLLGSLRSLQKNWVKTLVANFSCIFKFWGIWGF